MKCDYCGRGIRRGEEREQEVRVSVSGGRKTEFSEGMEFKEYRCCSSECRMKMFGRVINALSEEGLQRKEMEEDNLAELEQKKKPSKVTVSDVALAISIFALAFARMMDRHVFGIALPSGLGRLEIGCAWGAKTVDVLASRSMFDGFVTENGTKSEDMDEIIKRNHLITEYNKAVKEELKYGCSFAAISGEERDAKVRFYSPHCAAAS